MIAKRQLKKLVPKAIDILVSIAEDRFGTSKISEKDVEDIKKEVESLFSEKEGVLFLSLRPDVDFAFSSKSLNILYLRFNGDFSTARKVFSEWHKHWSEQAPSKIQNSFRLDYTAVSRDIFRASE